MNTILIVTIKYLTNTSLPILYDIEAPDAGSKSIDTFANVVLTVAVPEPDINFFSTC